MNELLEKVKQGDFRSIARLISMVENSDQAAYTAVSSLYKSTGHAHIVGITGPPGVGKSTLVNEIAKRFAAEDKRVAILAVDPSSPFSGGALLGDRVRMQDLADQEDIFIRSMASRGALGGLASSTSAVITVFDAAQFEIILVETIGAGQAEVSIASAAHTTLVVQAPGSGDEVQKIKAGILEIADILVVNKADRPGALRTVQALESMLQMGRTRSLGHHAQQSGQEQKTDVVSNDRWSVPVVQTVAIQNVGIEKVLEQIKLHWIYLMATDEWMLREIHRSRNELERLMQSRFMALLATRIPPESRDQLVLAVVRREIDPYTAASRLFEEFGL